MLIIKAVKLPKVPLPLLCPETCNLIEVALFSTHDNKAIAIS